VNALMEMLGIDYTLKAPPDLLVVRHGESHPTERACLFGKRLVVASETPQGRRLNEALVKELTGGERITGRRMREDFWDFWPSHKFILSTNHRPVIRGTDDGIWRRVRLVPFTVQFWDGDDPANSGRHDLDPALRQDKRLGDKLRAELSGILRWAVEGCLDWQRDGLTLPDKVRAATNEYRNEEDQFRQWECDRCFVGPEYRCRASELYADYHSWCERGGYRPESQKVFGEQLTKRKFERRVSNGTWYLGIALRTDLEMER
jgi:putative DNA primase/helicase